MLHQTLQKQSEHADLHGIREARRDAHQNNRAKRRRVGTVAQSEASPDQRRDTTPHDGPALVIFDHIEHRRRLRWRVRQLAFGIGHRHHSRGYVPRSIVVPRLCASTFTSSQTSLVATGTLGPAFLRR